MRTDSSPSLDFDFVDIGLFEQLDQGLDLANVHGVLFAGFRLLVFQARMAACSAEFVSDADPSPQITPAATSEKYEWRRNVFARMDVGQMHFDERDGDREQGVAQRDAGVREGRPG